MKLKSIEDLLDYGIKYLEPSLREKLIETFGHRFSLKKSAALRKEIRSHLGLDKLKSGTSVTSEEFFCRFFGTF